MTKMTTRRWFWWGGKTAGFPPKEAIPSTLDWDFSAWCCNVSIAVSASTPRRSRLSAMKKPISPCEVLREQWRLYYEI